MPATLPLCGGTTRLPAPTPPRSICNQLAGTTVCDTAFALLAGSEAFLNATCSLLLPALIDDSRCAASPKPATLPTTTLTELPAGPE